MTTLRQQVKMIFKPEEYVKFKSARTMYGDKDLLNILEKDKIARNEVNR